MRPLYALYVKELRQLWPLGLLWALFNSGDLLYRPFKERLDELRLEQIASYLDSSDGAVGWVLLVLAGAVAYAAFIREHEERTIQTLYALPMKRGHIFFAKVLAGWTIPALGLACLAFTDGMMGGVNHQTITGGHSSFSLVASAYALQLAFCLIVYGHALLASVLRWFGILPYAILLLLASILEDVFPPAAWIDPTELLGTHYVGTELVIPWVPLAVHAALSLVALSAAGLLWLGPAESIGKGFDRARATTVGRIGLGCAATLVGTTVLVLLVVAAGLSAAGRGDPTDDESRDPGELPSVATVERVTERYQLQIPESHLERAQPLIARADAIHAEVQALHRADPGPRLIADLTEVSGEHLGIASWTHIRVGLVHETDPLRLERTFAHETAHAFQHRLSEGRQGDNHRSVRFFAEGAAEWVSLQVIPGEAERRQLRVVAAAMWERHHIDPDVLFDDEVLRERYDTTLVYTLGERWTQALVDACGEGAMSDALRSMASGEVPRHLTGRAFWRALLRLSGCDVERVDVRFAELLNHDAEELRAEIDALPRMGGGVIGEDGATLRIVARLDRDGDPSWLYHARVRADPGSSDSEAVSVRGRVDPSDPRRVTFSVPRALLPSSRFQLQFLLLTDPNGWPYAEPWQWAGR
ncbi:MAG: ABC transporter permease subunit [Sandaracinaceae bacterium]